MEAGILSGVEEQQFTDSPTADGLIGAFRFNHKLAQAYRVIRFVKSPGMQELGSGFEESSAEHMWRATLLWDNVAAQLPNLAEAVDSQRVRDLIMVHDIGEIMAGDVSRFTKVMGEADDQYDEEVAAISALTVDLEDANRQWFVDAFKDFENPDQAARSKESLVANLIESVHGDFTFFDEADLNPRQISDGAMLNTQDAISNTRRVVGKYTRPHFVRLINIFESEGDLAAADDLRALAGAFSEYISTHRNPHIRMLDISEEFLTTVPEE